MTHVYVILAKRKRRLWFGHTWEVSHAATSKEQAQEWLRAAMARKEQDLPPRRYGHSLDDHYRWLSLSADSPYGSGAIFHPANAADIFYVEHYGYES